jgi:hypothetical protein
MKFLEKDLEQIIWDADKEILSERGLNLDGKLKRQLKIGNYGIADLIHFKRPVSYYDKQENKRFNVENGLIEIIELKNENDFLEWEAEYFLSKLKNIQTDDIRIAWDAVCNNTPIIWIKDDKYKNTNKKQK